MTATGPSAPGVLRVGPRRAEKRKPPPGSGQPSRAGSPSPAATTSGPWSREAMARWALADRGDRGGGNTPRDPDRGGGTLTTPPPFHWSAPDEQAGDNGTNAGSRAIRPAPSRDGQGRRGRDRLAARPTGIADIARGRLPGRPTGIVEPARTAG